MSKGIDVSEFQKKVDWTQVVRDAKEFTLIRATMGATGHDSLFDTNAKGAHDAGLEVFAYGVAYVESSTAKAEAEAILKAVKPHPYIKGVALDVEGVGVPQSVSASVLTQYILDWASVIENAGYAPIVYMDEYFLANRVHVSRLKHVHLWQAQHSHAPTVIGEWHPTFWQYSSTGKMPGALTYVDLDEFYGSDITQLGGTSMAQRLLQFQRPYMTGSDVKTVQEEINNANIGVHLATDGIFGPNTEAGVKAFQRHEHLSVDGVVGKNTYAVLAKFATPAPATPAPSKAPSSPPPASSDTKVKQLEADNAKLTKELDAKEKELGAFKASVRNLATKLKNL